MSANSDALSVCELRESLPDGFETIDCSDAKSVTAAYGLYRGARVGFLHILIESPTDSFNGVQRRL